MSEAPHRSVPPKGCNGWPWDGTQAAAQRPAADIGGHTARCGCAECCNDAWTNPSGKVGETFSETPLCRTSSVQAARRPHVSFNVGNREALTMPMEIDYEALLVQEHRMAGRGVCSIQGLATGKCWRGVSGAAAPIGNGTSRNTAALGRKPVHKCQAHDRDWARRRANARAGAIARARAHARASCARAPACAAILTQNESQKTCATRAKRLSATDSVQVLRMHKKNRASEGRRAPARARAPARRHVRRVRAPVVRRARPIIRRPRMPMMHPPKRWPPCRPGRGALPEAAASRCLSSGSRSPIGFWVLEAVDHVCGVGVFFSKAHPNLKAGVASQTDLRQRVFITDGRGFPV